MLKKFLMDVVTTVVGKQSEDIVDILYNKKHINEFIIAKKLNLTINQTRNILYKLSDYGLVSSIRKKDKKKGWYTYFWRFEISKAMEFLKSEIEKKILQIKSQIKNRETRQFYICEKCNIEFNEENALLHNFTCPECGEVLSLKDNTKVLRDLKRNLERLDKEQKLIGQELEKEKQKTEKVKVKELKKIEKEKSKKRTEARNKRRALKNKKIIKKATKKNNLKDKKIIKKATKKKIKRIKKKIKRIKKKIKKSKKIIKKIKKISKKKSFKRRR